MTWNRDPPRNATTTYQVVYPYQGDLQVVLAFTKWQKYRPIVLKERRGEEETTHGDSKKK